MISWLVAAAAAVALAPNSTPYSDDWPPVAYQKDVTVQVEFASRQAMQVSCQRLFGQPPTGSAIEACNTGSKIVMPNPCTFPKEDRYAQLLCHEIGHANGWPSTHGDAPLQVAAQPAGHADVPRIDVSSAAVAPAPVGASALAVDK